MRLNLVHPSSVRGVEMSEKHLEKSMKIRRKSVKVGKTGTRFNAEDTESGRYISRSGLQRYSEIARMLYVGLTRLVKFLNGLN